MKIVLALVLTLCCHFLLQAQTYQETEQTKTIKDKIRQQNLFGVYSESSPANPFKVRKIYYPYAFYVSGDMNSKAHQLLIKELTKKSGVQWDFFDKSNESGYIIVPSPLVEEYKRYDRIALQELVDFSSKPRNIPEKFTSNYNEELGQNYGISMPNFYDFLEYLDSRNVEQIPFSFKNAPQYYKIDLPLQKKVSKKQYPYYGKVTIKVKDTQEREIDSYGYIYGKEKEEKPWGEEGYKEFKATVTTTSTTKSYDVYCDGLKITSAQHSVVSDYTHYEGGGLMGAIAMGLGKGLFDAAQINGYEDELYRVAQQQVCFYEEDASKKGKAFADRFYTEASAAFAKGDYYGAIKKLDASAWANENLTSYELRGDLFNRFGLIPNAVTDYLAAIKKSKADNENNKLSVLYRKLAVTISSLKGPIEYKTPTNDVVAISPDLALAYLQKAAKQGDTLSKKILETTRSPQELVKQLAKINKP